MTFSSFQYYVFKTLSAIGLLPKGLISIEQLDYHYDVRKMLDEYRELIEAIDNKTGYFSSEEDFWSNGHAGQHDDYLVRLYEIRYQKKPNDNSWVRGRPKCLRPSDSPNR
ncbi:hypothetical protein [Vibrio scophthalmi]|uniref:Uncharacterized protein n=1 Tax=Vibrio scophthalmi LMG 19158 TaxID=870967 RepID=F9RN57_9VIBR|nr:hypothetical protein [Vibrio scophthalmi]EGU37412.1 hypothetical protein VIS19158_08855 [Vibrio scophthalmi LMG 19158]